MISAKSVLAVVLAVLAVSCSKTETAKTASTPANSPAQVAPVAPAPATATTPLQPATAGAIASADGEVAGTRVDVRELKRTSGGTLNLKFVLVNGSPKDLHVYSAWLGDASLTKDSYRNVSGIHLIDPVNKKKYFVVTDAEKNCVCSTDVGDPKAGASVNLWAKFPAPPPEVQKVTIEIPHFQPIDDVPISQ